MPETIDIAYGLDADMLPTGDVLYVDQLLVGDDNCVRIDGTFGDLVHLVCAPEAQVVALEPPFASGASHAVMVDDMTLHAYTEIAVHILDL